jgi:hypothetical protein
MISPSIILWDCFGSPDILKFMKIKLRMSLQGRAVFTILLDQSHLWGLEAESKDHAIVL